MLAGVVKVKTALALRLLAVDIAVQRAMFDLEFGETLPA